MDCNGNCNLNVEEPVVFVCMGLSMTVQSCDFFCDYSSLVGWM